MPVSSMLKICPGFPSNQFACSVCSRRSKYFISISGSVALERVSESGAAVRSVRLGCLCLNDPHHILYEQRAILAARIFLSLYLALVYLKPLPELGLALSLQRKKLSDVMVADN